MAIKILVCIGILAVIVVIQLIEDKILGIDRNEERHLTPVGWLKFGFILFLLWQWVGTFCI